MILAALAAATIQPRVDRPPVTSGPPCATRVTALAWRPSPDLVRLNMTSTMPRARRVISMTLLHHGEPVLREFVTGTAPGGPFWARYYQPVAADATGLAVRMRISGPDCRPVVRTRRAGR